LETDSKEEGKSCLNYCCFMNMVFLLFCKLLLLMAEAMKIENKYGSIEKAKADLIIFDKSPFDTKNFPLSEKLVIKAEDI